MRFELTADTDDRDTTDPVSPGSSCCAPQLDPGNGEIEYKCP